MTDKTPILWPFVTVTPTIQSGVVVRWFASFDDMDGCRPSLSASRDAVVIHDASIRTSGEMSRFLARLEVAHQVQGQILNRISVRHLATHERTGLGGPFLEIAPAEDIGSSPEVGA